MHGLCLERQRAELLWKQGFRFSHVGNIESVFFLFFCASYTMSQTSETPINTSRLLRKRGPRVPPQHNLTSPLRAEAPPSTLPVSPSVCQPRQTPNSAISAVVGKVFGFFLTASTSLSLSVRGCTVKNSHVGVGVCVCVCVFSLRLLQVST